MTSLMPKEKGGIINKEIREALIEAMGFSEKANDDEMIDKGPVLIDKFQDVVEYFQKTCPPKVSLKEIAKEFNKLCSKKKDLYSCGIEYGWLQNLMDCSNFGFPEELPVHTRVGLGGHAGFDSIEEEFLLRDAFLLLIHAQNAYDCMHKYNKKMKKSNNEKNKLDIYKILSSANQNVAMYSRLCILSFYSFVEAFVNSVGYDFSVRNKDNLSVNKISILHGKRKGRYLTLQYKIEKYPSIIRSDKKTPIILSESKKIKESFKKFFMIVKEVRDSSVHYSPKKEAIWRKPDDWIDKAISTSNLSLSVSLEFWKACYPDRKEPEYLNGLDYDRNLEIARKRFKTQTELYNQVH